MDAYSPFPLEAAADAIGFEKTQVPLLTLIGGILGGLSGFLMQYWIHVYAFPLNIGGRPLNSWPSFIIITFEMTILFAGITAVVGMLTLNGLPQPYHPDLQSSALQRRQPRPLLPLHRGGRSHVRPGGDQAAFCEATDAIDVAEVAD